MRVYTERVIAGSHWLPKYKGKCRNLHGHNWRVCVSADGLVDSKTGMLCDFNIIKNIIDRLDHTNINKFIENPTAENITLWLLQRFKVDYQHLVWTVRVYEAENSYAEGCL